MSLKQKIGQMFMVNLFGSQMTEAGRDILEVWQPGSVVLLKLNVAQSPEQIKELVDSYQQTITDVGGVPLFVAVDQEGGLIQRLRDGFTIWPVPMVMTAADDSELVEAVGRAMGQEMRFVGINMNLAPVADLYTNIGNPIIGRRSFGSDPNQVGRTVEAFIDGMQSVGVMATAKHFPGHGATSDDSHTSLPEVALTRSQLDTRELIPFKTASSAGSVMVSHIWFSQIDPAPTPASLSAHIVTDLLRDGLEYDGLIMTDALDMDAIDVRYSLSEAAIQAILAGHDMIIIGANVGEQMQDQAMSAVLQAVLDGQISEERIDDSVRRILMAKSQYDVLDWEAEPFDGRAFDEELVNNAELVEHLFQAGLTVVKNTNVIPVGENQKVGIVFPGTRYQIQSICGEYRADIMWLARSESPTDDDISAAVNLASQVDITVVFTHDAYYDDGQANLVNRLPSDDTVVIALSSPFDLARFPEVAGYIATYSPLDTAVDVACGIIFGDIQAAGVSPVEMDIALDE